MKRTQWAKPVSAEEAARRAGGRRRHNRQRQEERFKRLEEMAQVRYDEGDMSCPEYARRLGVSRTTAWRDRKELDKWSGIIWPDGTVSLHRGWTISFA